MNIRRACKKDIDKVIKLLSQVLEIHAKLRPDLFISGTTKYSAAELEEMFQDETKPVYAAVDENDDLMGYVMCVLKEPPVSINMVSHKTLYIDDLCVDESARGQHVGQALFQHVKNEARRLGCYNVTLNVWEGNDSARHFYEKMELRPQKTQMEYILEDNSK